MSLLWRARRWMLAIAVGTALSLGAVTHHVIPSAHATVAQHLADPVMPPGPNP